MNYRFQYYICRCTVFYGTPTVHLDIMSVFDKLPLEQREIDVRLAITGGAPCSADLIKKFRKSFPGVKLMVSNNNSLWKPRAFQIMRMISVGVRDDRNKPVHVSKLARRHGWTNSVDSWPHTRSRGGKCNLRCAQAFRFR